MARNCRYHCRGCNGHFSSLKAFDLHHPRNRRDGGCEWPEDAPLVEVAGGACRISSGPTSAAIGITLYEHMEAANIREHFRS